MQARQATPRTGNKTQAAQKSRKKKQQNPKLCETFNS
jgi:hypothetical protein